VLGSVPVFVEPCKFSRKQDRFSNHFLWKLTCVFLCILCYLSICLYACNNLSTAEHVFMIQCWGVYQCLLLSHVNFHVNKTVLATTFYENLHVFSYASWVKVAECLVGWKMFAMKVLGESETHNLCQVVFLCKSYCTGNNNTMGHCVSILRALFTSWQWSSKHSRGYQSLFLFIINEHSNTCFTFFKYKLNLFW